MPPGSSFSLATSTVTTGNQPLLLICHSFDRHDYVMIGFRPSVHHSQRMHCDFTNGNAAMFLGTYHAQVMICVPFHHVMTHAQPCPLFARCFERGYFVTGCLCLCCLQLCCPTRTLPQSSIFCHHCCLSHIDDVLLTFAGHRWSHGPMTHGLS